MRCMSIAVGSSTSAARCNKMPTWRWSRTACCAAAIDFGRPSVIGSTRPGNSTVLRTGTMIIASGGSGGSVVPPAAPVAALSLALMCWSATIGACFLQCHDQTTGRGYAAHAGITPRRQAQPAVKAALRQFEPMDRRRAQLLRQNAGAGNDEIAVLDHSLSAVRSDARQRNQDQNFELGFQNVDRRLPGRQLRALG